MIKYLTCTIAVLFLSLCANGENRDTTNVKERKNVKYFDLRFENGLMLDNGTEEAAEMIRNSYYNGIDLRLGFRNIQNNNIYSNVYRRPYIGVGFYSSTFHNRDIGKPNAVYFFITVPFTFEQNKRFSFSYSGAFGLSFNFNPYDSISNPTNLFIGSEQNCYFHFGIAAGYRISDRVTMNFTTGIKHFSNGSFKKPNKGLNLIPFTLGVSYKLTKEEIPQIRHKIPEFIPHNVWLFSVAAGSKHYDIDDRQNYLKMTYSFIYLRQTNYKYRFGGGIDLFYSAHPEARIPVSGTEIDNSFSAALTCDFEWAINENLSVPIGFGFYLKRNEANEEVEPYYERTGMKYRFNNNLFAAVTIKAHGGKADYFEWTIGYALQKDRNRY
jgi:hypothetical protein